MLFDDISAPAKPIDLKKKSRTIGAIKSGFRIAAQVYLYASRCAVAWMTYEFIRHSKEGFMYVFNLISK